MHAHRSGSTPGTAQPSPFDRIQKPGETKSMSLLLIYCSNCCLLRLHSQPRSGAFLPCVFLPAKSLASPHITCLLLTAKGETLTAILTLPGFCPSLARLLFLWKWFALALLPPILAFSLPFVAFPFVSIRSPVLSSVYCSCSSVRPAGLVLHSSRFPASSPPALSLLGGYRPLLLWHQLVLSSDAVLPDACPSKALRRWLSTSRSCGIRSIGPKSKPQVASFVEGAPEILQEQRWKLPPVSSQI